jgi:hypothetical protein
MKILILCFCAIVSQSNAQEKPVVHLQPHHDSVDSKFGGSLLELINAPPVISLPTPPPLVDAQGNHWAIDIKNLGPHAVTISDKAQFSRRIMAGETLHINSNGKSYALYR